MIDFHTHLFSWPYFEALAKQSPLPGSVDERLERMAKAAGIELPSKDLAKHVARWSAELDRNRVARAVCFASVGEEAPAVAEAAVRAEGQLVPFALVDPRAEGAAEKVRALLGGKGDFGFRGLLLFPALHRFRMAGPEAAAVLAVANAHRAVVVVQCGLLLLKTRDLLGLSKPYDLSYANPLDLVPPANTFPEVSFVVPHFGAGYLREALMLGAQCPNVYVDTSSSNSWIATQAPAVTLEDVFRRALDVFGPERILFGTDSSTLPRGWRRDLHDVQRKTLAAIGASEDAQVSIFGRNAERLLSRFVPA